MPNSNYLKLTFKWIHYKRISASFDGFIHFPGGWAISPMFECKLLFWRNSMLFPAYLLPTCWGVVLLLSK